MSVPSNYNPIRHDCETGGCWNAQYRPNIEFFYHALPRKITMSDIDGVVEVNGSFLFLEWKSHKGELPVGQRILAKNLTGLSTKITYVVVQHDPGNPMLVEHVMVVHGGKFGGWEECDMDGLFARVERWAKKVDIRAVTSSEARVAA